jgi:two-component system, NarL family, nitrate/nitrite response regulator NarL
MSAEIKILVADDHRLFIEGIKNVLKSRKNLIVEDFALTGEEVIAMCNSKNYDIVLMDINMPAPDGIEATRRLKKNRPEIKIIIVSMIDQPAAIDKALKAGADAYILKNFGVDELLLAIKKVMAGENYIPEALANEYFKFLSGKNNSSSGTSFTADLTKREREIIKLIAEGMTNTEVAEKLFISKATAETHRKNILSKLALKNTAALVRFATENNLL